MMVRSNLLIYAAHATFWLAFAAGNAYAHRRFPAPPVSSSTTAAAPLQAPHSRLLVGVHMVAFAVLYFGIEQAVFRSGMPRVVPGQRVFGGSVILAGAALMYWARVCFGSWRFRAEIDAGHQLATGGPFRFVRHPLYAGMDLLALGTAIWIPTMIVWISFALMFLGGDLRARAEEPLLEQAFGEAYRKYRLGTHRFVPGIY